MSRVIVVGGGAAGMFAAYQAAECGHQVTIIEQNEKLGKKIYITGKGRCNLTNASDMETIFANVMTNRKFLYSAFYACDNHQVLDFFHAHGLETKVERGNRVFPVSDHSSDVIGALIRALKEKHVTVCLNTKVVEILTEPMPDTEKDKPETAQAENGETEPAVSSRKKKTSEKKCGPSTKITGVRLADNRVLPADSVIIATGGISYPSTGSTGDGYMFAANTGHTIKEAVPSLVPLNIKEDWCKELQGLSLRNIHIKICNDKKILYEDFGELLFTHFGVSGPVILSASSAISPGMWEKDLRLWIDLKPALDIETLDRRILRDFEEQKNKQFKNALQQLFPAKLVPVMVALSGIDPDKKVNEIGREERRRFAGLIKALPLSVIGPRGWNEAIITRGGVSVKDVDASTMESKLVKNLYFAGEVIDVDAMTGGYNLQIAWSTGYLAGSSIR
jgi:predicted Rossmann fold flavoprotein